jgi:hypothetical protein
MRRCAKKVCGFSALWLLLTCAPVQEALCDEDYKFAQITCSNELGFLQIHAITLEDISADSTAYEAAQQKDHLYSGNVDTTCKIGDKTFQIKINYDEPRDHGVCGGDDAGHLTLLLNNHMIVNNIPFNWACGASALDATYTSLENRIYTCGSSDGVAKLGFCFYLTPFNADINSLTVDANTFNQEVSKASAS